MAPEVLKSRYHLGQRIGTGAFGVVYEATDSVRDRDVAIKLLQEQWADDERFVKRFQAEADHAEAIVHPNVVRVYDYDEDEGYLFIVMELVAGMNLKQLLAEQGPLRVAEGLRLVQDVLAGLGAIHGASQIHRDLKLQNVLVTPAGVAKISDFGLAKGAIDSGLTRSRDVLGTAAYMAPEQAQKNRLSPATDIYAVGVMLFVMLTGELPFSGDDPLTVLYQKVYGKPPLPRALNPAIPGWLEQIILKALATDPADRFASADEMAHALEEGQYSPSVSEQEQTTRQSVVGVVGITERSVPEALPQPADTSSGGGTPSSAAASPKPQPRQDRNQAGAGDRPSTMSTVKRGSNLATVAAVLAALLVATIAWATRGPSSPSLPLTQPTPPHVASQLATPQPSAIPQMAAATLAPTSLPTSPPAPISAQVATAPPVVPAVAVSQPTSQAGTTVPSWIIVARGIQRAGTGTPPCPVVNGAGVGIDGQHEIASTNRGFLHIQYWNRQTGSAEREVVLAPGRYRIAGDIGGHEWEMSPTCTADQLAADEDQSIGRRIAAGANTIGRAAPDEVTQVFQPVA